MVLVRILLVLLCVFPVIYASCVLDAQSHQSSDRTLSQRQLSNGASTLLSGMNVPGGAPEHALHELRVRKTKKGATAVVRSNNLHLVTSVQVAAASATLTHPDTATHTDAASPTSTSHFADPSPSETPESGSSSPQTTDSSNNNNNNDSNSSSSGNSGSSSSGLCSSSARTGFIIATAVLAVLLVIAIIIIVVLVRALMKRDGNTSVKVNVGPDPQSMAPYTQMWSYGSPS